MSFDQFDFLSPRDALTCYFSVVTATTSHNITLTYTFSVVTSWDNLIECTPSTSEATLWLIISIVKLSILSKTLRQLVKGPTPF